MRWCERVVTLAPRALDGLSLTVFCVGSALRQFSAHGFRLRSVALEDALVVADEPLLKR